jgi:hypothetical protein
MSDEMPIAGYPTQTEAKIDYVNENKQIEERLLRRLESVDVPFDGRFLAIARTHFQEGFMAFNRAIMQPQRIALPEDGNSNA